jgi:hypothetical protein
MDVMMALALLAAGGTVVVLWKTWRETKEETTQAFTDVRNSDFFGFPSREVAEKAIKHIDSKGTVPCACGAKTSWMVSGVTDLSVGRGDVRTIVLVCGNCATVRLVDAATVGAYDTDKDEWAA